MRYFFISDLHGCNPIIPITELAAAGFNSEQDTLVVLGDICDRGPYLMDIVEWLLSLPHTIFIWGNHDARLAEIVKTYAMPQSWDKRNGMGNSLCSILGWDIDSCRENKMWYAWQIFDHERHYSDVVKAHLDMLYKYWSRCHWCIEFPDLIATHAWLPTRKNALADRKTASVDDWYDISWADTSKMVKEGLFPEKRLIVGHWHAWRMRATLLLGQNDERYYRDAVAKRLQGGPGVDFSSVETEHAIFIDTCTTISERVNVWKYECDVAPIVYDGTGKAI